MRETEENQLLVSEMSESRKQGLLTMPGLPSFVSDDSLPEAPIIGYVFAQRSFPIDVIVYLFRYTRD